MRPVNNGMLFGDMVAKSMVAATSTKVKPRAQLHATALVVTLPALRALMLAPLLEERRGEEK